MQIKLGERLEAGGKVLKVLCILSFVFVHMCKKINIFFKGDIVV